MKHPRVTSLSVIIIVTAIASGTVNYPQILYKNCALAVRTSDLKDIASEIRQESKRNVSTL